ncbi:MAG: hypothetical protein U0176_11160 [Bacteroidia bacterium]
MPEAQNVQVSYFIDFPDHHWTEADLQADWDETLPQLESRYPFPGGLAFVDEWGKKLVVEDQVDYLLFQFVKLTLDDLERQGWSSIPYLTENRNFQVLLMEEIAVIQLETGEELRIPYAAMKSALIACAHRFRELLQRLPDRHPERSHDIQWLGELLEKFNAE